MSMPVIIELPKLLEKHIYVFDQYYHSDKNKYFDWEGRRRIWDNHGWTITGSIETDSRHYSWLCEFDASHPQYGHVWGNLNDYIYATSVNAYETFIKTHPYQIY